jgi:multimeric flavodoxin WrbA
MKILAINASHRGDRGYTRLFIDKLLQDAAGGGAECEVVTLARLKINRCLACLQCQTKEHYLHCVHEERDDVHAIHDKMATADMLIYGTPVYLYTMSGLLKLFLDRLYGISDVSDMQLSDAGLIHHHINPAVCSKPFVTLVVCGNVEVETTRNVLSYFRTYSRFMNAPQVGVLVRNATNLLEVSTEPERSNPRVRAVYDAYVQAGRELATLGRIQRGTQQRANQEIVPVPLFGLLKQLPFRPLKEQIVIRARKMMRR